MLPQSTTRAIPLTKGYSAIVDEADYAEVSRHTWHAVVKPHTVYAARRVPGPGPQGHIVYMHRELVELSGGGIAIQVHHVDSNGLNNSRSNLTVLSHEEHIVTRRPNRNALSQYKGVVWHHRANKWMVQVGHNGQNRYIGLFNSEEEAAHAYDVAARELLGPSAFLNFPEKTDATIIHRNIKSSRFRGVCWNSADGRWWARITRDGRTRLLGKFDDEETAARAYDIAKQSA